MQETFASKAKQCRFDPDQSYQYEPSLQNIQNCAGYGIGGYKTIRI